MLTLRAQVQLWRVSFVRSADGQGAFPSLMSYTLYANDTTCPFTMPVVISYTHFEPMNLYLTYSHPTTPSLGCSAVVGQKSASLLLLKN